MAELVLTPTPQRWGTKVSSDLTIPSSLIENSYDFLPIGEHDVVVVTESGVLRTVGRDIFKIEHGPLEVGGIATNSSGDLVLMQRDGWVTVINHIGERSGFSLPGQSTPNPLNATFSGPKTPASVFVATDTLGERIAICRGTHMQVLSRDGVQLAEHTIDPNVRAIALKGDSVLVASLTPLSSSDVELSLYRTEGKHFKSYWFATGGIRFDGPPEASAARGIVFSGDASTMTIVVPVFDPAVNEEGTGLIVVPCQLSNSQLVVEDHHEVILADNPWMPHISVSTSYDGRSIAVVGYADGDYSLYTLHRPGAGRVPEQVGNPDPNSTPFVAITNSGRHAYLGPLDKNTWLISGNL